MSRIKAVYFLLASSLFVIGFFVFFNSHILKTVATSHENLLLGWLWSDNIGWISLTCKNDNNCADTNYQVKFEPFLSGKFSGYAWSFEIGWIRFDPPGPYPLTSPNHQFSAQLASVKATNLKVQVQGWIRACSVFEDDDMCGGNGDANPDDDGDGINDSVLDFHAGDWDGWIKMSGSTNNCPNYHATTPEIGPYEVCLTSDYKALDGWAWGGDVIGWIEFNPNPSSPWNNSVFVPSSSTIFKEVRPR